MGGLPSKKITWNPLSVSEKVRTVFLLAYFTISDQFSNLSLFYLLFISLFCSLWIMINFTFETFQSSDTICPEHEGLIWKTNGGWTGKSQAFFRGFQIILANTWYTHPCFQLFCCLSAQNWTLFPVRLVFDIWYLILIFLYT